MVKKKKSSKNYNLLLFLITCLFILVLALLSFFIVDSKFWKERVSLRFNGENLSESFVASDEDLIEQIEYINPTVYRLLLNNAKKGDLISFYQEFDANWYAREIDGRAGGLIFSNPRGGYNNFTLRSEGSYTLEVFHAGKKRIEYLVVAMLATVLIGIAGLIYYVRRIR